MRPLKRTTNQISESVHWVDSATLQNACAEAHAQAIATQKLCQTPQPLPYLTYQHHIIVPLRVRGPTVVISST